MIESTSVFCVDKVVMLFHSQGTEVEQHWFGCHRWETFSPVTFGQLHSLERTVSTASFCAWTIQTRK